MLIRIDGDGVESSIKGYGSSFEKLYTVFVGFSSWFYCFFCFSFAIVCYFIKMVAKVTGLIRIVLARKL